MRAIPMVMGAVSDTSSIIPSVMGVFGAYLSVWELNLEIWS